MRTLKTIRRKCKEYLRSEKTLQSWGKSMNTPDIGAPTATAWYRQSVTKKYNKDQDWKGDCHQHQVHQADQYIPSAPLVQPPYNQPTNPYIPLKHPSIQDKISGYPSAPYPGTASTSSNLKVEPEQIERDPDDQDTDEDIKTEINRLREEMARIELKGKAAKYMKRSVQ